MAGMNKNSYDRSLLSQLSLCQAAPGRLSADAPVSWWKWGLRRGVAGALWLDPGEASRVWIHPHWNKSTPPESLHGGGACCSRGRQSSHSGHCRTHANQGTITQFQDKTSSSTRNEPAAHPKQINISPLAGLPPASADKRVTSSLPFSTQITGSRSCPQQGQLASCPQCDSAPSPCASRAPGHQSRYRRAQPQAGTAVKTQPSRQSLCPGKGDAQEEKFPFRFLLDVAQLLIRRKWQNKHNFASNLEKHPSPTKLLANKPNNNIPFWLRGPHGWHDRAIYSNIYMIRKLAQDNKQRN